MHLLKTHKKYSSTHRMNLLTTKNTYTYLYLKYTEEVEDKKSYLNTTGLL